VTDLLRREVTDLLQGSPYRDRDRFKHVLIYFT
jgi:hypothetical protein